MLKNRLGIHPGTYLMTNRRRLCRSRRNENFLNLEALKIFLFFFHKIQIAFFMKFLSVAARVKIRKVSIGKNRGVRGWKIVRSKIYSFY